VRRTFVRPPPSFPNGPFGHEALKQAVNNYTSGAYRLAVEYHSRVVLRRRK